MSWKDRLSWADASNKLRKKASFRNAFFFVSNTDASIGRKTVVHRYPKKDDPYIEDLGLDVSEFTITGYVVQNKENGQDYFDERDRLIAALKEKGPGTLIHPFFGSVKVNLVGKASIAESFSRGGIANFTMTFVQVGAASTPLGEGDNVVSKQPEIVQDPVGDVDVAVSEAIEDSKDGLGNVYANSVGFVADSIKSSMDSLNVMIKQVTLAVQGAMPTQVAEALRYLSESYSAITLPEIADTCSFANKAVGMLNGLLSFGGMYGDTIIEQLFGPCSAVVRGISSGPMSGASTDSESKLTTGGYEASTTSDSGSIPEIVGKTTVDSCLALNSFGDTTVSTDNKYGGVLPVINITTKTRAIESANTVATVNFMRLNSILIAARTAVRIKYTSYEMAIEVRDNILDAIDAFLLKLGNDSENVTYSDYNISISDPYSYEALKNFRPIFVRAMEAITSSLSKTQTVLIGVDVTSTLTVAYDKYMNLDREKEIIERNTPTIKHPGFLPGGVEINILNE